MPYLASSCSTCPGLWTCLQRPIAQAAKKVYQLHVVAAVRGPIVSSSGVKLVADAVIGEKQPTPTDTLLVAGAPNADSTTFSPRLLDWVKSTAAKTRRYGSVCSGAFVLGAAGLLDGKRVTTHWAVAENLARAYPAARVEADAIQVRDGRLRTAAGVTCGDGPCARAGRKKISAATSLLG